MSRDARKTEIPAEKLERYDRLLRERPQFERKGAELPYTSVNGHMFTFLSAEGKLGIRLPREQRDEFIGAHGASLFVAHGAVLKEYVTVPDALFQDTGALLSWLDRSYAYVLSLKPKKGPRTAKKGGVAAKRGGTGAAAKRGGTAAKRGDTAGKTRAAGGTRAGKGSRGTRASRSSKKSPPGASRS